MLNLTKYTKFTIKAFFNPIIIISAFGPSLANSASISYISSNSFYQYINRPFLGVLDFQIQAYTVVLGYTIAFLLFSKVSDCLLLFTLTIVGFVFPFNAFEKSVELVLIE